VRDLEEKVRQFDETNISSSESMTDLKRELAKYRDIESHSAKYVADLEARLARSDESIIALQQTVESLEKECARRRAEVEDLNSRLENLTNDGKNWRNDLTAREEKVKDLEAKMHEWEIKRREAADERARLGDIVGEVAKAKQNLQLTVPPSNSNGSSPYDSPLSSAGPATPNESSTETQLVALQETHSATLADLSSVTSKYRDALREIHDLSAQLQEAKVSSTASVPEPLSITGTPIFTRRKQTRKVSEPGRRPLFRQAASADSLHSRYALWRDYEEGRATSDRFVQVALAIAIAFTGALLSQIAQEFFFKSRK
jgi:kinesin family protein 4/21/27